MLKHFKGLTLLLFLSLSVQSIAQKGTQSPYSVYGIGELKGGQYAYFNALGGAQLANTDSTIITQSNPATFVNFNRNKPVFQVGLSGKFTKLETSLSSANVRQLGLNQFQLGLPVKKNWGASFGLTPFSSTGYLISNPIFEGVDTIAMKINEGKGTISNFHIGLAYKQSFGTKSKLSVGANLNYLFGGVEKIQSFEYTSYPDDALHSRVVNSTNLSDTKFDFGFLFEQKLSRGSFTVGGTFSPAAKINSTQNLLSFAYSKSFYQNYSYFSSVVDTAEFTADVNGITYIPESFGIGVEYRLAPEAGSKQSYLIIFKGDLKQQNWSKYYTLFNGERTDSIYSDRTTVSFGIDLSPHANARLNDNLIPYLSKLHYRFGFNYTLSEIDIDNTQLTNYGINFGLGIPILNGNSNTNLNLGISYGAFGTTENDLIKENNLGVSFGVSISPGVYDRWFIKRKYD